MAKQRLTQAQIDKYYGEYVKIKSKNYAGRIMTEQEWKDDVETILQKKYGDEKWSNSKIRDVSIRSAKREAWTDKQLEAFKRNFTKDADAMEAFQREFADNNVGFDRFVENNQGFVFAFLQGYSDNWNEYFNS